MKLAVIGTGYVGLVTGTCFAESGNDVTCVDVDADKIRRLQRGDIPIYEPGLTELVQRNMRFGRLKFSTSAADVVPQARCVFIAVGTPQGDDGSALETEAYLAVAELRAGGGDARLKEVVRRLEANAEPGSRDIVERLGRLTGGALPAVAE